MKDIWGNNLEAGHQALINATQEIIAHIREMKANGTWGKQTVEFPEGFKVARAYWGKVKKDFDTNEDAAGTTYNEW